MPPADSLNIPDLDRRLDELDERGYAIIPNYLDRTTTAEIRTHIDSVVGSHLPEVDNPWDRIDEPRVIRKDEYGIRKLRHPIAGAIMPRIASNQRTIELSRIMLGSRLADLRLREQVFGRTDRVPAPNGPTGWHIDAPFTAEEFQSTPRRIYYQLLHYCSKVESGGGAFMIVPGSHQLAYAVNRGTRSEEQRQQLQKDPIGICGIDTDRGIEICGDDGDLIIFNAMCLHSASLNKRPESRYVYFTSFYDASADWLVDHVRRTRYRDCFPNSLYRDLPARLHHLLAH